MKLSLLVVEFERTLTISWRSDAARLDTTVPWTLHPEGNGTRLLLRQDGFIDSDPRQRQARDIMGNGWDSQIAARLGHVLSQLEDADHEDE